MNIRLHIERLILDGLPLSNAQGRIVQASVESELARLLSENGLSHEFSAGGAVPSVGVKGFQTTDQDSPTHIGRLIARSAYGGIGKTR